MEEDDSMEIDPDIAEAMGFAGFGTQKKRKFNANDGYVDPATSTLPKPGEGKGANSIPLGQKKGRNPVGATNHSDLKPSGSGSTGSVAQAELAEGANTMGGSAPTITSSTAMDGKPTLEALRRGVRNANGDMAYFLPSFLEDPWKDLRPK